MEVSKRSLVLQLVLSVLITINVGLLIWRVAHQEHCPEIMPPKVYTNGHLNTCVKDPSSTPERLVWNCTP
jgi:hypothetical protein